MSARRRKTSSRSTRRFGRSRRSTSERVQVVELRFFGGLSVEETAEVLKISPETVMRDWKFAKGWLLRELSRATARKT